MPDPLETVSEVFGPGRRLAQELVDWEWRPQQQAMAQAVAAALADRGRLAVEAGTGVGKSLAYLVPAAAWAGSDRGRVVVSTYTRILQDQLARRDTGLLKRVLPDTPRIEVAYGQENYLCRLRLHTRVSHGLFDSREQARAADGLLEWSVTTGTGVLLDAPVSLSPRLSRRVGRESAACLRRRCPYYGDCFWYRARRAWESASILIVNHALFFAGTGENGVLPEFSAVVFDEAHRLEDAAVRHFGVQLVQGWLVGILDSLNPASGRGLLQSLHGTGPVEALVSQTTNCRAELTGFFGRLNAGASEAGARPVLVGSGGRQRNDAEAVNVRCRLRGAVAPTPADGLERLGDALGETAAELSDEELAAELGGAGRWLREAAIGMRRFAEPDKEDSVRWLETGPVGTSLHLAPLSVAGPLAAQVYERLGAVVLTSATLTVANDFSFVTRRLGLDGFRFLRLDSPFDHRANSLFFVPARMPLPADPDFVTEAARLIGDIVAASRGRALVLFTSFEMMRRVYDLCDTGGHTALLQGEMPVPGLLEEFRTDVHSVLFATQSFWQGVDVPGESLSCLIICRLPFEVPDDPRLTAIVERLRAEGSEPFTAYQLPTAVLRFRQGFGRLIRSRRDRGAVCVLDRRIVARSYGDAFRRSLPEGIRLTSEIGDLERFFGPETD